MKDFLDHPTFWQYLLAAELPPRKSSAILEELETGSHDAVSFLLSYPYLTEGERKRLKQANLLALEQALASGAWILTQQGYPETLKRISYAPPALFVKGDSEVLVTRKIGIVGTRKATSYGKAIAKRFAERFARNGAAVVSGGAFGIDAAAHQAALDAGGQTIVVLPTGIDQYYPAHHVGLFEQARRSGCLISPYAVASKWHAGRPILRNFVIAALSEALVVIESPQHSGALMTAGFATELGREVFVVPANIDHPNFRGSHQLIRDGATLVDDPDQVLNALGIDVSFIQQRLPEMSFIRKKILDLLREGPMDAEKIGEQLKESPSTVLPELTMLEMEGHVFREVGGYILRK